MHDELGELSLTDRLENLDDPPWMYGNQKVTWASPPPLGEPSPPPRPDEFDRVVRETLVDKLTERAHLEKRVETVHNGGQPEANESCGIAMRALWAVPLVFAAKGLKFAAKPLVGCCSVGRAPAERLTPSMPSRPTSEAPAGFPRESNGSGDAALLAAKLAGSQPSSATAAASDMLPSFNEAASQPAQAVPPTGATAFPPAAAIPAASSGAVPDVRRCLQHRQQCNQEHQHSLLPPHPPCHQRQCSWNRRLEAAKPLQSQRPRRRKRKVIAALLSPFLPMFSLRWATC